MLGNPPMRYIQVTRWHCPQEGGGVGLRCRGCSCPRSYRFSGTGDDPEATQILSKAYDIACRSLHRKGQPPVVQELLARKIIEAAQHGERDPDRLAGIALGMLGPVHREVSQRFGLVPNFFRPRMRPRLSRSCGISPSRPISTARSRLSSRSGCSSSCRGSARSAIALLVIAHFWSATAMHPAMFRPPDTPSSRRSSCSRCRHRGGGRLSRSMNVWRHSGQ